MVKRPTTQEKLQTPPEIIEAVRELATGRTDAEIADLLNQQGFLTGKGRKFTKDAVNWKRLQFQLGKPTVAHPTGVRADGCYSTKARRGKTGSGNSHHPLLAETGSAQKQLKKLHSVPGGIESRQRSWKLCEQKSAACLFNLSN